MAKEKQVGRPENTSSNGEPEVAAVWAPVAELTPWAKNPRRNDHVVDEIARSIKRFGFGAPLLARKANGEVIAGHTRLKAAIQLGLDRVPVRYLDLDPAEAHLLALADNRLGETAEWLDDDLAQILAEYSREDAELAGWDGSELDELLASINCKSADELEDDEVPDPPDDPITRSGDVWKLGEHRLWCADATSPEPWAGVVGDMIWTDPPYGVSFVGCVGTDPRNRDVTRARTIVNDDLDAPALRLLLDQSLGQLLDAVKPGACVFVAGPAGPPAREFINALCDIGVLRQILVWLKSQLVFGRSDYHYRHELLFYGWKPGSAHHEPPDRTGDSVWEYENKRQNSRGNEMHPTMKPIGLVARAIERHSRPGELVLDAFTGSGTTLIACEQLGRRFHGTEIDPRYCDVIVRRWEELTGRTATREARS